MKLHLPLGLRRALYNTFIAVLAGTASVASYTWAAGVDEAPASATASASTPAPAVKVTSASVASLHQAAQAPTPGEMAVSHESDAAQAATPALMTLALEDEATGGVVATATTSTGSRSQYLTNHPDVVVDEPVYVTDSSDSSWYFNDSGSHKILSDNERGDYIKTEEQGEGAHAYHVVLVNPEGTEDPVAGVSTPTYTLNAVLEVGTMWEPAILEIGTEEQSAYFKRQYNLFIGGRCYNAANGRENSTPRQIGEVIVNKGSILENTGSCQINVGQDSHSLGYLTVNGGTVINDYCISAGLSIGAQGYILADNGGHMQTRDFWIAGFDNSYGEVLLDHQSTLTVTSTVYMATYHGVGYLTLRNGSSADINFLCAAAGYNYVGGEGHIALESGSTLTANTAYLGYLNGTKATLDISGGASAEFTDFYTSYYYADIVSSVTVSGVHAETGEASSLNIARDAYISGNGSSTLEIRDGGQLSTEQYLWVGYSSTGTADVLVSGVGSSIETTDLVIAAGGAAEMTIEKGAQLNTHGALWFEEDGSTSIADGAVYIALNATGRGSLTVTGTGTDSEGATVASTLNSEYAVFVGYRGAGSLVVSDGAVANVAKGVQVHSNSTADIVDATLNGNLIVLEGGVATLDSALVNGNVTTQAGSVLNLLGTTRIGLEGDSVNATLELTGTTLVLDGNWQGAHVETFSVDAASTLTVTDIYTLGEGIHTLLSMDSYKGDLTALGLTGVTGNALDFFSLEVATDEQGRTLLNLNVNTPYSALTWDASATGGVWSTSGTTPWISADGTEAYIDGKLVVFKGGDVTVEGSVTPGGIWVQGDADTTFSGTGEITGATPLVKNGNGTLTINMANSYTSGTTVNGGTLVANAAGALGSGAISINGGTLALHVGGVLAPQQKVTLSSGGFHLGDGVSLSTSAFKSTGGTVTLGEGAYLELGSGASLGSGTVELGRNAGLKSAVASSFLHQTLTLGEGASWTTGANSTLTVNGSLTLGDGASLAAAGSKVTLLNVSLGTNKASLTTGDEAQFLGEVLIVGAGSTLKTGADASVQATNVVLEQGATMTLGDNGTVQANSFTLSEGATLTMTGDAPSLAVTDSYLMDGSTINMSAAQVLDYSHNVYVNGHVTHKTGYDTDSYGGWDLVLEQGATLTSYGSIAITGSGTESVITLKEGSLIELLGETSTLSLDNKGIIQVMPDMSLLDENGRYYVIKGNISKGDRGTLDFVDGVDVSEWRNARVEVAADKDGICVAVDKKDITWNNEVTDGVWKAGDTGSAWLDTDTKAEADNFYHYDSVTIDGGSEAGDAITVTVDGSVMPANTTVVTGARDIVITGSNGSIDGKGALTVTGSGKLNIDTNNSYSGITSISGGSTVTVTDGSSLGAGDISIDSSTLVISQLTLNAGQDLTLAGTAVVQGSVVAGSESLLTLGGSAEVTGSLTLMRGTAEAFGSSLALTAVSKADTMPSVGTLDFTGSGKVTIEVDKMTALASGSYYLLSYDTLTGPTASTDLANYFDIKGADVAPDVLSYTLSLNDNKLVLTVTNVSDSLLWKSELADNGTENIWSEVPADGAEWIARTETGEADFSATNKVLFLGGTAQVQGEVTPSEITVTGINDTTLKAAASGGSIVGDGKLIKDGDGKLIIEMANSFTGGTTIKAGTVLLNGEGTLGSGDIELITGFLGGDNDLELGKNQTLTVHEGEIAINVKGDGDVTKVGTGTATMSGTSEYTGMTRVEEGKLVVTGSLTDGGFKIGDGAELLVSGNGVIKHSEKSSLEVDAGGKVVAEGNTTLVSEKKEGAEGATSTVYVAGEVEVTEGNTVTVGGDSAVIGTVTGEGNLAIGGKNDDGTEMASTGTTATKVDVQKLTITTGSDLTVEGETFKAQSGTIEGNVTAKDAVADLGTTNIGTVTETASENKIEVTVAGISSNSNNVSNAKVTTTSEDAATGELVVGNVAFSELTSEHSTVMVSGDAEGTTIKSATAKTEGGDLATGDIVVAGTVKDGNTMEAQRNVLTSEISGSDNAITANGFISTGELGTSAQALSGTNNTLTAEQSITVGNITGTGNTLMAQTGVTTGAIGVTGEGETVTVAVETSKGSIVLTGMLYESGKVTITNNGGTSDDVVELQVGGHVSTGSVITTNAFAVGGDTVIQGEMRVNESTTVAGGMTITVETDDCSTVVLGKMLMHDDSSLKGYLGSVEAADAREEGTGVAFTTETSALKLTKEKDKGFVLADAEDASERRDDNVLHFTSGKAELRDNKLHTLAVGPQMMGFALFADLEEPVETELDATEDIVVTEQLAIMSGGVLNMGDYTLTTTQPTVIFAGTIRSNSTVTLAGGTGVDDPDLNYPELNVVISGGALDITRTVDAEGAMAYVFSDTANDGAGVVSNTLTVNGGEVQINDGQMAALTVNGGNVTSAETLGTLNVTDLTLAGGSFDMGTAGLVVTNAVTGLSSHGIATAGQVQLLKDGLDVTSTGATMTITDSGETTDAGDTKFTLDITSGATGDNEVAIGKGTATLKNDGLLKTLTVGDASTEGVDTELMFDEVIHVSSSLVVNKDARLNIGSMSLVVEETATATLNTHDYGNNVLGGIICGSGVVQLGRELKVSQFESSTKDTFTYSYDADNQRYVVTSSNLVDNEVLTINGKADLYNEKMDSLTLGAGAEVALKQDTTITGVLTLGDNAKLDVTGITLTADLDKMELGTGASIVGFAGRLPYDDLYYTTGNYAELEVTNEGNGEYAIRDTAENNEDNWLNLIEGKVTLVDDKLQALTVGNDTSLTADGTGDTLTVTGAVIVGADGTLNLDGKALEAGSLTGTAEGIGVSVSIGTDGSVLEAEWLDDKMTEYSLTGDGNGGYTLTGSGMLGTLETLSVQNGKLTLENTSGSSGVHLNSLNVGANGTLDMNGGSLTVDEDKNVTGSATIAGTVINLSGDVKADVTGDILLDSGAKLETKEGETLGAVTLTSSAGDVTVKNEMESSGMVELSGQSVALDGAELTAIGLKLTAADSGPISGTGSTLTATTNTGIDVYGDLALTDSTLKAEAGAISIRDEITGSGNTLDAKKIVMCGMAETATGNKLVAGEGGIYVAGDSTVTDGQILSTAKGVTLAGNLTLDGNAAGATHMLGAVSKDTNPPTPSPTLTLMGDAEAKADSVSVSALDLDAGSLTVTNEVTASELTVEDGSSLSADTLSAGNGSVISGSVSVATCTDISGPGSVLTVNEKEGNTVDLGTIGFDSTGTLKGYSGNGKDIVVAGNALTYNTDAALTLNADNGTMTLTDEDTANTTNTLEVKAGAVTLNDAALKSLTVADAATVTMATDGLTLGELSGTVQGTKGDVEVGTDLAYSSANGTLNLTKDADGYTLTDADGSQTGNSLTVTEGEVSLADGQLTALTVGAGSKVTLQDNPDTTQNWDLKVDELIIQENGILDANLKTVWMAGAHNYERFTVQAMAVGGTLTNSTAVKGQVNPGVEDAKLLYQNGALDVNDSLIAGTGSVLEISRLADDTDGKAVYSITELVKNDSNYFTLENGNAQLVDDTLALLTVNADATLATGAVDVNDHLNVEGTLNAGGDVEADWLSGSGHINAGTNTLTLVGTDDDVSNQITAGTLVVKKDVTLTGDKAVTLTSTQVGDGKTLTIADGASNKNLGAITLGDNSWVKGLTSADGSVALSDLEYTSTGAVLDLGTNADGVYILADGANGDATAGNSLDVTKGTALLKDSALTSLKVADDASVTMEGSISSLTLGALEGTLQGTKGTVAVGTDLGYSVTAGTMDLTAADGAYTLADSTQADNSLTVTKGVVTLDDAKMAALTVGAQSDTDTTKVTLKQALEADVTIKKDGTLDAAGFSLTDTNGINMWQGASILNLAGNLRTVDGNGDAFVYEQGAVGTAFTIVKGADEAIDMTDVLDVVNNELTISTSKGTVTLYDSEMGALSVGTNVTVKTTDAMTVSNTLTVAGTLNAGGNVTAGVLEGSGHINAGTNTLTINGADDTVGNAITAGKLDANESITLTGTTDVTATATEIAGGKSITIADGADNKDLGALTLGLASSVVGYDGDGKAIDVDTSKLIYKTDSALTLAKDDVSNYTLTDAATSPTNALAVHKGTVALTDEQLSSLMVGDGTPTDAVDTTVNAGVLNVTTLTVNADGVLNTTGAVTSAAGSIAGTLNAGGDATVGAVSGTVDATGFATVGAVSGTVMADTGIAAGSVTGGSLTTEDGALEVTGAVAGGSLTNNGADATDGITIGGNVSGVTHLTAAAGSVTLNGAANTLEAGGSVTADKLVVNGESTTLMAAADIGTETVIADDATLRVNTAATTSVDLGNIVATDANADGGNLILLGQSYVTAGDVTVNALGIADGATLDYSGTLSFTSVIGSPLTHVRILGGHYDFYEGVIYEGGSVLEVDSLTVKAATDDTLKAEVHESRVEVAGATVLENEATLLIEGSSATFSAGISGAGDLAATNSTVTVVGALASVASVKGGQLLADSVSADLTLSGNAENTKHSLGVVSGTETALTLKDNAQATATSVDIKTLTMSSGTSLESDGAISATAAITGGALTSTGGNITLTGNVAGDAALSATAGTIDLTGATVELTNGSSITGGTLALNTDTAATVTNGTVSVDALSGDLTLSGGTTHDLGVVTGDTTDLSLTGNAQATADSLDIATLTTTAGTSLTATAAGGIIAQGGDVAGTLTAKEGDIELTGATVSGVLTAEKKDISLTNGALTGGSLTATLGDITLDGVTATASTADITATNGTLTLLNKDDNSYAGTVDVKTLDAQSSATFTNTLKAGTTTIAADKTVTLSGGTQHSLGTVSGNALTLEEAAQATAGTVDVTTLTLTDKPGEGDAPASGSQLTAESVEAGSLTVNEASTLKATGDITATTGATIGGTVTSTAGNISLTAATITAGADVDAAGTLTMVNGSATQAELTAKDYVADGTVTLTDSTLDFGTTTVAKDDTLNIVGAGAGSDLGTTTVTGGTLNIGTDGDATTVAGTLTVTEKGEFSLIGTEDAKSTFTGDVTISGASTATLTNAEVDGDVTLDGQGDTLNITDSSVTETLSVGGGSTVNIDGTNTVGDLLLEEGSKLLWTEGSTLSIHQDGSLTITDNSQAEIGKTGIEGDIDLLHGSLYMLAPTRVEGDITFGGDAADSRLMVVDGTVDLTAGTLAMEQQGTIRLGAAAGEFESAYTPEGGGTLTVGAFGGAGTLDITGTGDIEFATAATDTVDHTGDIVVDGLTGTLTASAENSLGTAGTLTISGEGTTKLNVTADQKKAMAFDKAVEVTAGTDTTLSGKVTGTGSLDLTEGTLTLTGEGNDLAAATVATDSTLNLTHTADAAGHYGSIENAGTLNATNANIDTLTNMGTADVTGGTLGDIINPQGSMTVTGTTLAGGANITNGDADDTTTPAELTLNGVTNVAGTTGGTLTNNSDGTLNIGKSDTAASDLTMTEAALGGTVNVTGESTLTTTGKMTVSGTTVLGDATGPGDKGTLVSSGTEGMDISGSVKGTGDLTSEHGTIAVTGSVDLSGTVTSEKLTLTEDATVTVAGDGVGTGTSSSLGEVTVGDTGNEVLTLKSDDFSGDISVVEGGTLVLGDDTIVDGVINTTLTGDVNVTDANLTMNNAQVNGNVTFENETAEGNNEFTINGDDNLIIGTLTVSDGTTTTLNGTLTVQDAAGALEDTTITDGGSYIISDGATLNSDVVVENGTLTIEGTLDAGSVTFDGADADSRDILVNTEGTNVSIDTLVVNTDGTITINGADADEDGTPDGTTLTLGTLKSDSDLGDTLTLNGTPTSGVVVSESNAGFSADIDLDVSKLTVQADEAIGKQGTLTMIDGSTLATEAEGELTISKDITGEKDITVETANGLVLAGDVDAEGTITKTGGGDLTFSGATLTADQVDLANGSTIVLDGEESDVENFVVTSGTLEVTNGSTLEAATGDDNTITLNGATTDAATLLITGTELVTGVKLAVDGQGTIQTDKKTTLTDAVTGTGTLAKTGADELVLTNGNTDFTGTLVHTEGTLVAEASDAFGTGTVQLNKGTEVADDIVVELNAADGSFSNDWDAQTNANLVATEEATLTGAFSGNGGTITKTGEMVTITGDEGDANGNYTIKLTSPAEGETNGLTLDTATLAGTLEAAAGTDVIVTGEGKTTVGTLKLAGDHKAAHNTLNENATHVVVEHVGAGATADVLSTGTATNANGAQLVIGGWENVNGAEVDPHSYADSTRLLVAENIQYFDKEIVHDLELRNVNLVHGEDGHSYIELSHNHKAIDKNRFEQGVSDAITASEGADGRLGELVEAMYHTGSGEDARAALNSIGGAGIATTMAAQMAASRDHMRTLRGSIGQPIPHHAWNDLKGCPQNVSPTNVWTIATGSSVNLGNDGMGGAGYTRHDAGVLLGGDVTIGKYTLVGLAAGYSRSHVNSASNTVSGDHYFVDAYGRHNIGKFTQAATFGVGVYDWSLDRSVSVKTGELYADFYGEAKGQAKGTALNFSYEAAYEFDLNENNTLAPIFQLESSLNHLNGYREGGTLGNAGLDVSFDDTWVTTLGLGARYAYEFNGFGDSWQKGVLSARALFVMDVGDVNGKMTGSFIGSGAAFSAESTKASREGILLGADALVPVSRHWSVFGNVSFEIRDNYRDVSAGAGVRYTF